MSRTCRMPAPRPTRSWPSAQKTATARGEEIVGEARAQAAALKQKAEADIAQERKKAVNEVKDEIGGIAMEIASKVVEREIKRRGPQGSDRRIYQKCG